MSFITLYMFLGLMGEVNQIHINHRAPLKLTYINSHGITGIMLDVITYPCHNFNKWFTKPAWMSNYSPLFALYTNRDTGLAHLY